MTFPARAVAAAATLLVVAGLVAPPVTARPAPAPARSQRPGQASRSPAIDIVDQRAVIAADGTFRLTVDVSAAPPGGRLTTRLHRPVEDRDQFRESQFVANLPDSVEDVPAIETDDVPPLDDGTRRLTISIGLLQPGGSSAGTLNLSRGLREDGVYPVVLRLEDDEGTDLATAVTYLVRFGSDREGTRPLATALVLDLGVAPTIAPDGTTRLPAADLERLSAVVDAAGRHPEVPLTLVPTPETIDALARDPLRGADLLARLRAALPGRQLLDRPYVDLPLGGWIAAGLDEELTRQRDRGTAVLTEHLARPDGRTWVADEQLTTDAAARLRQLGVDQVVVGPGVLAAPADDNSELDVTQPFQLATGLASPLRAASVDPFLQQGFTREGDDELIGHHLIAELAVMFFDDPTGDRGVVLRPPPRWRADAGRLEVILDGLEDSRAVLAPTTIETLFERVPLATTDEDDDGDDEDDPPVVRRLAATSGPRLDGYAAALGEARALLASFAGLVGLDAPIVASFDQRLLVSGSEDLSPARRDRYLAVVADAARSPARAVEAPLRQTVTLTAREADVPLTLRNRSERRLEVVVQLTASRRLEFPQGTRIPVTLDPGSTLVNLRVRAPVPGDTPFEVRVTSPDGNLELAQTRVTVRSTAVSGIGLILSVGAGGFLVAWWFRHWHRARRERRAAARLAHPVAT